MSDDTELATLYSWWDATIRGAHHTKPNQIFGLCLLQKLYTLYCYRSFMQQTLFTKQKHCINIQYDIIEGKTTLVYSQHNVT